MGSSILAEEFTLSLLNLNEQELLERRLQEKRKYKGEINIQPRNAEDVVLLQAIKDLHTMREDYEDAVRLVNHLPHADGPADIKSRVLVHLLSGLKQHVLMEKYVDLAVVLTPVVASNFLKRLKEDNIKATVNLNEALLLYDQLCSQGDPDDGHEVFISFEETMESSTQKSASLITHSTDCDPTLQEDNFRGRKGVKRRNVLARARKRSKRNDVETPEAALSSFTEEDIQETLDRLTAGQDTEGQVNPEMGSTDIAADIYDATLEVEDGDLGDPVKDMLQVKNEADEDPIMILHSAASSLKCELCGDKYETTSDYERHLTEVHSLGTLLESKMKGKIEPQSDPPPNEVMRKDPELDPLPTNVGALSLPGEDFVEGQLADSSGNVDQETTKHVLREQSRNAGKISETDDDIQCRLCQNRFLSQFLYLQHLKYHKRFKCTLCQENFLTPKLLKIHKRSIEHQARKSDHPKHKKKDKCKFCGKLFPGTAALEIHLRIHTGEKPFICEICSMSFSRKSNLNRHYRTHSGEKQFQCSLCVKSYSNLVSLKEHQSVHTGELLYLCTHCGSGFRSYSQFHKHKESHRESPRPKSTRQPRSTIKREAAKTKKKEKYVCEICSKVYKTNGGLNIHKRTHRDQPMFQCEFCDKGFHQRQLLKVHQRTHTGDLPFECGTCGKRFNAKFNLKRHKITHIEEKKFQCDICGKWFAAQEYLDTHKNVHNSRRFKCILCSQEFNTATPLYKHKKLHHKEQLAAMAKLSQPPDVGNPAHP